MILADTSVWIEFLKGNAPVHDRFARLLEDRQVVATAVVIGELLQGTKGERETRLIDAYWNALPQLGNSEHWISAGRISSEHRLLSKGVGLIDAFLVAVAAAEEVRVWTLDKKLNRVLATDFPNCGVEESG